MRRERGTALARIQVFYTCDTLFVGGLRLAHGHVLAFQAQVWLWHWISFGFLFGILDLAWR